LRRQRRQDHGRVEISTTILLVLFPFFTIMPSYSPAPVVLLTEPRCSPAQRRTRVEVDSQAALSTMVPVPFAASEGIGSSPGSQWTTPDIRPQALISAALPFTVSR